MAKEDQWLRASLPVSFTLIGLTLGGLVLLGVHAFLEVPSYIGAAGWVLLGSGILGVLGTGFVLSRRHGLGVLRSGGLAVKMVIRWIFHFAP